MVQRLLLFLVVEVILILIIIGCTSDICADDVTEEIGFLHIPLYGVGNIKYKNAYLGECGTKTKTNLFKRGGDFFEITGLFITTKRFYFEWKCREDRPSGLSLDLKSSEWNFGVRKIFFENCIALTPFIGQGKGSLKCRGILTDWKYNIIGIDCRGYRENDKISEETTWVVGLNVSYQQLRNVKIERNIYSPWSKTVDGKGGNGFRIESFIGWNAVQIRGATLKCWYQNWKILESEGIFSNWNTSFPESKIISYGVSINIIAPLTSRPGKPP